MPDHNVPENEELWKFAQDLNTRIANLEHQYGWLRSAFPQNDLSKPDYDGHRKDHLQIKEDNKVVAGYKGHVTKTVLAAVAGGLLTMLASGFMAAISK